MTSSDIQQELNSISEEINKGDFRQATKLENALYLSLLFAIRDSQYDESPRALARLALAARGSMYERYE